MLKKIIRLIHTLRYLRPQQLVFFVWRRLGGYRSVKPGAVIPATRSLQLAPFIATNSLYLGNGSFCFLNSTSEPCDNIDWSANTKQRLWAYNLHYFDYLRQSDISNTEKQKLIQSWINANPQQSQPGWEPFTASLRIVNWIYFLTQQQTPADQMIHQSLYTQCLWLEKNDERHILANHYFENLKALLFAGVYFQGRDAQRWLKKAMHEIKLQLLEQTLADGGHYERSPQYHSLMLENYLDIYNLVVNNPACFSTGFETLLKQTVRQSLAFINAVVFPDHKIPLLNDSAWGAAPLVNELNGYASQLISDVLLEDKKIDVIDKPDSGLYGLKTPTDMLIMDCGELGPSYQPGHTHCDFLSYELMREGRRIVVDTGVCEYQPGERRHYLRSTAAHNTVAVEGDEQSEIWGEFRVARRAQKIAAAIAHKPESLLISGSYAGFYGDKLLGGPRFRHERQINVKLVKESFESVEVVDTLSAYSQCQQGRNICATSYIHLHPDVEAKKIEGDADGDFKLSIKNQVVAKLKIDAGVKVTLAASIYCPEFGVAINNSCFEIEKQGVLPLQFGYRLKFLAALDS